jgi:predicted Zn finger-like uncharacterized protein
MDVNCTRCGAEYEFEESLVSSRGITVKCTSCGHLFKVFRPGASSALIDESRPWLIRKTDGSIEPLVSLNELARMIAQGAYQADDEISRFGKAWKRLGDIAELQSYFALYRSFERAPHPRNLTPPAEVDLPNWPIPIGEFDEDAGTCTMERPRRDSPRLSTSGSLPNSDSPASPDESRASSARETVEELRQRLAGSAQVRETQTQSNTSKDRQISADPAPNAIAGAEQNVEIPVNGAGDFNLSSDDENDFRDSDSRETTIHRRSEVDRALAEIGVAKKPAGLRALSTTGFEGGCTETPETFTALQTPDERVESATRMHAASLTRRQKATWLALGAFLASAFWVGWTEVLATRTFQTLEKGLISWIGSPYRYASRPINRLMPATVNKQTESGLSTRVAPFPAPEQNPPASYEDRYIIYVEKGELSLDLGEIEKAEKAFREALNIRPDAPRALVGIGYTELEKGNNAEAIAQFLKAAPQGYSEAYIGLGDAYVALKRTEEAIDAYQNYVSLEPNGRLLPIARLNIARLQKSATVKKRI